ncbi:hypothetical protein AVEN_217714-1 [Araneus ventricosus]|uniref:RNase H type-1 domain-containing protein n=1 Tax=Araneus ventricosus TaxID=182803 RepID=A0A4Y2NLT8_ARAVE|nr:hypothetical protein AVEN_217714-1 [Araneus ventricosus]
MADTNLHEVVQTDVFFYHEVQHQLSVVNFPSIEQWDFTCDFKTACPMLTIERSPLRKEGLNIFCWVPSPVGISGNEITDSIAKFASFLSQDIPYSDVKKSFVSHLHATWHNNWYLQVNNKLHFVKPFIDMWPMLPIRELDVESTRLRIGHTRFTHKHLIFGERTPMSHMSYRFYC